jgi:dihydroorotate dehydrogenase
LCGIELDSCLGLASGFDRDGEAIKNLHNLGFSFIELGTITPEEIEEEQRHLSRYADEELAKNRYNPMNKGSCKF